MLNVCQSIQKPSVPPIHLSARWLTRSHSSERAEWRSKLTVIPSRSQSFEYESKRQSLSLSSLNILSAAAGARCTATLEPHFVAECISEVVEITADPFLNSRCVIANNEGFKTSSFVRSIQKMWTKPNKRCMDCALTLSWQVKVKWAKQNKSQTKHQRRCRDLQNKTGENRPAPSCASRLFDVE